MGRSIARSVMMEISPSDARKWELTTGLFEFRWDKRVLVIYITHRLKKASILLDYKPFQPFSTTQGHNTHSVPFPWPTSKLHTPFSKHKQDSLHAKVTLTHYNSLLIIDRTNVLQRRLIVVLHNWSHKHFTVYNYIHSLQQIHRVSYEVIANGLRYIAFGIGDNGMQNAEMYVAFLDGKRIIMSKRESDSNSAPNTLNVHQDFRLITLQEEVPDGTQIAFSFMRQLTPKGGGKHIPFDEEIGYIWAGSDSSPEDRSDPQSSIPKHSNAGRFSLDFTTESDEIKTGGDNTPILTDLDRGFVVFVHGLVMLIAWAITPFFGYLPSSNPQDIRRSLPEK
jgi:hypothetical protein